jgi:RNA polymerase sigma-70 factor (ECF subfamily)
VDDVVQDVLLVVIAKVPTFKHNGHAGSFRSWLRGIVKHRLLTFWRQQQRHPVNGAAFDHFLTELEDDKSDIAKLLDDDHDRFVVGALLEAIKGDFQPGTWDLFWQTTILGEAIDAVAQRAGVTHNAVFIARSRVLQRLRQESAGLLDQ